LIQELPCCGVTPKLIELENATRDCISRNAEHRPGHTRMKTCHYGPLACSDEFSTYSLLDTERVHIETITSHRPEANDDLDRRTRDSYARQVAVVLVYEKRRDSGAGRNAGGDAIEVH
jgi:hypothetical protein